MGLCRLDTCCCCVNLDIGSKIIGFVWTLLAALVSALYAVPVALLQMPSSTMLFFSTVFITSLMQFITGCMMIVGLFQKRPALMWPWLTISWFLGGGLLLIACIGFVLLYIDERAGQSISYVSSAYVVYSLVLLYFTTVVRSRRDEIQDELKWQSGKRLMRPVALKENIYV
ncbi:hypothetical protein MSG28_004860 [Choristoneura fumiferana]|uniref:Uncharacterized protein n=1 Tax=Choristoneura fumiferana TaxID=7141 RepID=A0ACC0K7R4_CHOFU|nr:hypothetical protein MSG28_004860 [Choristoneura fumiferana]